MPFSNRRPTGFELFEFIRDTDRSHELSLIIYTLLLAVAVVITLCFVMLLPPEAMQGLPKADQRAPPPASELQLEL